MAEQWEYRHGPGYTSAAGFGPQQQRRPARSQPPAIPPQFRRDEPPAAPPPPSFTPGYQPQRPHPQHQQYQQPAWQQPVQQPYQPPVQPYQPPVQPYRAPVQQPWQPPKPPRKNRAGLIGCVSLAGVVFVILLAVALSPSPSSSAPPAAQTGTSATQPEGAPSPAQASSGNSPAGTVSQMQALAAAQGYLSDGQGFSLLGLIGQLDSPDGDNFSVADATWAVDHSGADWDAQAVESAKGYMSTGMGFSRAGLIQQLTSADGDQFTQAQATYAANAVGL
jgi:hypothetical protein